MRNKPNTIIPGRRRGMSRGGNGRAQRRRPKTVTKCGTGRIKASETIASRFRKRREVELKRHEVDGSNGGTKCKGPPGEEVEGQKILSSDGNTKDDQSEVGWITTQRLSKK
jgi:hypothetical protein